MKKAENIIVAKAIQKLIEDGNLIYSQYMKNGKKFSYASLLKINNLKLLETWKSNADLFPDEFQKVGDELVNHINVWAGCWEDTFNKLKPNNEDIFVFENTVNYPKQFDRLIENFIRKEEERC